MPRTTAGTSKPAPSPCRFPFISNEIFNCEVKQILDKFFEAPKKKEEAKSEHEEEEDQVRFDLTPGH